MEAPLNQDDDHVLWYKLAMGAAEYANSQGAGIPTPLNQYDEHTLLFLAAQAMCQLANP